MLLQLGYRIQHKRVAPINQALRHALRDLSTLCDVVVTAGGVSTGDSDWIRPLVAELGEVNFWKLFLKRVAPSPLAGSATTCPFRVTGQSCGGGDHRTATAMAGVYN